MTFSRNIAAAVAISGAALTIGAMAAIPASAATPACSGDPAGFCGSQINTFGNAWTAVGAQVTASPAATAGSGADFIAKTPAGADANVRQFQFAPNDKPSGLCVSEPSTTPNAVLTLRPCRAASNSLIKFQKFAGINPGDTSGTPWVNVASHLTVQANGTGNDLRAVKVVTNPGGAIWGFDSPAVPPAN